MQVYEGDDIWEMIGIAWIVIPTNIGYKAKPKGKGAKFWSVGPNVMGRGLARDATDKYPEIAQHYGEYCFLKGPDAPVTYDLRSRLIFFPVKPMDEEKPWQSWKHKADLDLIRKSAAQLNEMLLPDKSAPWPNSGPLKTNHIVVPVVGCGNGKLEEDDVIPVLKEELDDRHTLYLHRPF